MIKKVNGEFFVYNKNGKKKLSKAYKTKKGAEKRLKQIEFFKHRG